MRHRHIMPIAMLLLLLVGIVAIFSIQGELRAQPSSQTSSQRFANRVNPASYVYYTLKQTNGFVLARAPKGASGQPLSAPQPITQFGEGFGLAESDGVLSMQLSPDGRYLAVDGNRDHGEQVWIYDTQHMTISLKPAAVMGNFLHWLPGATGHTFLYRPMFPLGPSAPRDGDSWNQGLWEVDAATGSHRNIDIAVPSVFLLDAVPSPDGSRIVYSTSSGLGMGSDTWLMRQDGSNRTHLFHSAGGGQAIAGLFAWSPDGQSIAYERLSDSPTPFLPAGLWMMNALGGQQKFLAEADGGHGYIPSWSPDSHSLAYIVRTNVSNRVADREMQALQTAIAVVNVINGRSMVVASAAQTNMQMNVNPQWIANGSAQSNPSITFLAFNPINRVLGGTPRYWLARVGTMRSENGRAIASPVTPLTPAIPHVIATS